MMQLYGCLWDCCGAIVSDSFHSLVRIYKSNKLDVGAMLVFWSGVAAFFERVPDISYDLSRYEFGLLR